MDHQRDAIETAGAMLDRHDSYDLNQPSLLDITGINQHRMPTASGLNDHDYPDLSSLTMGLKKLKQLATINKIPIPPEIMDHFKDIKCQCMMGLFPEIGRAWLTIDSDLYIWTYEHGRDVAYFDGLTQLIVSVGLVTPKANVFVSDVKYLLVITTPVEIVILGVTFVDSSKTYASPARVVANPGNNLGEMQIMNKPIFVLSTDNNAISVIKGTSTGRIFLGGRDGCLYEIAYQAESSWLGKRYKKINHSQGVISYMVPSFLKIFSETEPIIKIEVDNVRKLLYTLTENGSIEAWDIGDDSSSLQRIARASHRDITSNASNILKTVDASVFKQVTSICILSQDDCPNLHLLAITQCGVRIYFATNPITPSNQEPVMSTVALTRPQGLYILHVRLPPGYTPNAKAGKPKQVHSAYYSDGNLLMVTTPQQDQDILWSLSKEPFLGRQDLSECATDQPLGGHVWGMAETMETATSCSLVKKAQTSKKVVLLTNQGALIVALFRPMDLLQQLLIACNGPHHEAVKAYFRNQTEAEACATTLLLACNPSTKGTETEVWATQAFFLYGGEPMIGGQMQHVNSMQQFGQTFMDNSRMVVSTPYSQRVGPPMHQSTMQPGSPFPMSPGQNMNYSMQSLDPNNICFSARHTGLYLCLSRLLRPIWKMKCVTKELDSTITSQDCMDILDDLYSLRNFLDQNSNNVTAQGNMLQSAQDQYSAYMSGAVNPQQRSAAEMAHAEEKRSLEALTKFIKHVCEVLSLWKILIDHQISLLLATLSADTKSIIGSCTFRELIISQSDTCATLIVTLINFYFNDNASISTISSRLRDVCPTLYRDEDAVTHKAAEILMMSKNCNDNEEKEERLRTALQLCKGAAPNLPLSAICQQFIAAGYIHGVIELCAVCAHKIDPNNTGLHFYNNNEQPERDHEGFVAYSARVECYKEIKNLLQLTLQNLYNANVEQEKSFIASDNTTEQRNMNSQILKIISLALKTNDHLLHIAVYEWLLSKNLFSELLSISEPTLGEFLARSVGHQPDNINLADILWKYYERNGQHAAAAKILDKLATLCSESIDLEQRIDYLSRAVMCMRSHSIGYSAHNGVLLKDLEDKLEMAKIQKMILKSLSASRERQNTHENIREIQMAVKDLNSALYNITQLYSDFADRFGLGECKLIILNWSHHIDIVLIESVWIEIIDEILQTPVSPTERFTRLITKIKLLAIEFGKSGICFPLAFLTRELEIRSCQLKLDPSIVPNAMLDIKIEIETLMDIYTHLIALNERVWLEAGNEWQLVQASIRLMTTLASKFEQYSGRQSRKILAKAEHLISTSLNLLYPKPDTNVMVDTLRNLEVRLKRNAC